MEKLYYSSYNAKTKYELVCNSTYSSDLLCYTNGSHKVLLSFCGWSVRRTRSYRCEKNKERQEFKLGDAQGIPSKYSKDTQASNLGDAPVGIPSFFFNNYWYTSAFVLFTWFVSFVFFFFFKNHASMRCPFINFYNDSCASLISFEYDLIECSLCFT